MARKVFFSFHYEDIWRVNVIRNSHIVEGTVSAGFMDASLWEEAKKKGAVAIKRMIDGQLTGTSVTCVLIGQQTASRDYVDYEIKRSMERGNGLLGIRIHNIKDKSGNTDWFGGSTPSALKSAGAPVYDWDRNKFGEWVEAAYQKAQQQKEASKTAKAGWSF